jgi:hypothetical protein
MFPVNKRQHPLTRGLYLEWLYSQPEGESGALYNKERILSKYEKKNLQ